VLLLENGFLLEARRKSIKASRTLRTEISSISSRTTLKRATVIDPDAFDLAQVDKDHIYQSQLEEHQSVPESQGLGDNPKEADDALRECIP